jgi:NAD(P)-dependent dehydrogenase (short-subunit alcohol dehydrogenase family)
LGRAICQAFAASQYRVAVHYARNASAATACRDSLEGTGHVLVCGPIAQPLDAQQVFNQAVERLGGIDVVVNNAGIYQQHPPLTSDWQSWVDAWQQHVQVNLLGPAWLCHLAVEHMRPRAGGVIINISSRGAYRGEPHAPAYGATKAGLNSLTQSLAAACAPAGILVYGIAPGWIDTDMATPYLTGPGGDAVRQQSPLNRVARPEEIARIAVFLADPDSSWLTGSIIDANGASYFH